MLTTRRPCLETPSIDPFSAKNEPLEPLVTESILQYVGLLGGDGAAPIPTFRRRDGSPGRVDRRADILKAWRSLPQPTRTRIHLACIPMHDSGETAVIVNVLQRHATVVTQKSTAEGFGLTVVEAMWKERPVVATRVGGIVDQIVDDESGLLIDDPLDLASFGAAINRLLGDSALARRIGVDARECAHRRFLGDHQLELDAALFADLIGADPHRG